jgi:hypothetical protein
MKYRIGLLALVAVLALTAVPAFAGDDVTMTGGFVWTKDDGDHEGDLKAVFTPAGKGEWTVAFHFDWEDGPHVYTGTCKGSFDGELSGDITSDGERKMNFRFSGKFVDGEFSGTHGFVDGEEVKDSGTLTLIKG